MCCLGHEDVVWLPTSLESLEMEYGHRVHNVDVAVPIATRQVSVGSVGKSGSGPAGVPLALI